MLSVRTGLVCLEALGPRASDHRAPLEQLADDDTCRRRVPHLVPVAAVRRRVEEAAHRDMIPLRIVEHRAGHAEVRDALGADGGTPQLGAMLTRLLGDAAQQPFRHLPRLLHLGAACARNQMSTGYT